MTVTYIKQFRDDLGEITHEHVADNEIRAMNHQIEQLKIEVNILRHTVAYLRELLDAVRKIAYDINEQMLKGQR
jgi:hypothetical protein